MPTTRSASGNTTRPRRSPRKAAVVHSEIEENKHSEANVVGVDGVVEEESDSDEESVVQIQLKSFTRNLKKLETNLKEMRKQNQKLQRQLDVYKDGAPTTPKKRAAANVETTIKIQEMEERIKELERKNSHWKKKIKKIQQRELKVEAKDLNRGGFVDNVGDPDGFTTMRKLLRRFVELMETSTLSEEKEKECCPICFELIRKRQSYSLPCDHLICIECLPHISQGADETVKCPICRKDQPREDLILLRMTETQRWDQLLEIAQCSAYLDYGAGTTSSEQEEEDFIDDGDDEEESRTEASDRNEADAQDGDEEGDSGRDRDNKEDDEENQGELASPRRTPERTGTNSYANSPTSEKRKRMAQLAMSRAEKKQRVL